MSSPDLQARIFSLPERAITKERAAVVFIPYNQKAESEDQRAGKELLDHLRQDFNLELAAGRTYPQRDPVDEEEFKTYFHSYYLIVAYFVSSEYVTNLALPSEIPSTGTAFSRDIAIKSQSLFTPANLAVSYYIKPNYQGRSSHVCNGGFVVPESSRGLGIGGIAGQSFLYYAPRCGFKSSIFNLVYDTNQASVRIWKKLGFETVGRIPKAGLLRTEDGKDEIYVDANVIYGDFEKIGVKE